MSFLLQQNSSLTTFPQFMERLPRLMTRNNFKPDFIDDEMKLVQEGYVVSKTSSRSMVAFMNQMTLQIELRCAGYPSDMAEDLDKEEDIFMDDPLWQYRRQRYSRDHIVL